MGRRCTGKRNACLEQNEGDTEEKAGDSPSNPHPITWSPKSTPDRGKS